MYIKNLKIFILLKKHFEKCNTTHYNYQNTDKNGHFLNR